MSDASDSRFRRNTLVGVVAVVAVAVGIMLTMNTMVPTAFIVGGNLCADSDAIAAVCGVPPVGAVVSIVLAVVIVSLVNQRLEVAL